jgi:hypothetical protein
MVAGQPGALWRCRNGLASITSGTGMHEYIFTTTDIQVN